ncbi:MAG: PIN domain-containing protein [Spirochaetaceae bacterium]|nr:PIN domain-containing protein [Spirochaetaceae bacterium]
MTVGVDTSVIIAAVHANHPVHLSSSRWLDAAFDTHDVVVAHHSLLEAYAVLTRLPAEYRVTPAEAEIVLRETVRDNARIAPFAAESTWAFMSAFAALPAAGGAAYDAFIIRLLSEAGAEAIVTYNVDDFRRLSPHVRVTDPAELEV